MNSPSHSLRYPWLLSHTVFSHSLTHPSHLIVVPVFSYTSLLLPLIPYSVFSHTPTLTHSPKSSHTLTPITCATMLTHPRLFSHHSYYHSLTLSVLTLSVLTPIVIPDYSLTPLVSHSLTHPRVLSHLTSLSAHTHHLSSHTHHLTSSVTTRTLTSFSLVSPH